MNRLTLAAFFAAIIYLTSFSTIPSQKTALHTIIIDPGHGGFDYGCSGLFSREKDVALSISMKLGAAIQEAFPDIKIVYTRTTDVMPGNASTIHEGLRYRADMANKAKGDLFICIHANSNGHAPGKYEVRRLVGHKLVKKGSKKRRVPVYEYETKKNMTAGTTSYIWKAMWGKYKGSQINENMGDSTAVIDVTSPEARIRAQLYEKKYFANSAFFGQLVQDEFVKAGRKSEGVQQRDVGIWVLEATGMPSVLIETGYLTNEEEEKYLNSEEGQNEVVQNMLDAFIKYKNAVEGNRGGQ
jgi:N-acetylmuramoyl-L-alanine amidase